MIKLADRMNLISESITLKVSAKANALIATLPEDARVQWTPLNLGWQFFTGVFAAVPGLLLRTAFGPDYETGAGVLLTLGCAYALLAASYLAVQFLLGVAGRTFALVLAAIAVAEPLLLLAADSLRDFATVVLGVQAAGAVVLLGFGLARRPLAAAPVA